MLTLCQCRFVHKSPDKCAFVRANCPDEEAGLISYLQLYYCSLPHAHPVAFVILVTWIALLFSTIGIAASDFLCINLSTISSILGMSESLAGVTFLAFGNGSPDVFSTFAAMNSHSGSLAVGELIGAASFITAVVAGSMALVRPFTVARKSFFRDVGFFVVATCFSMGFLADGRLQMWECACMVGFYLSYVVFVVTWHWWLSRSRHRRLREAAARLHHHIPRTQELDVQEEAEDEDAPAGETTRLLRAASDPDFAGLEANVRAVWKKEDAIHEDDERPERHLNELRSNMRVSKPARGERRNTSTPIRPSLVGALEFLSVLHSLEKRGAHISGINLRRYSDDPNTGLAQFDGRSSEPAAGRSLSYQVEQSSLRAPDNISGRGRAVSANDAAGLELKRSGTRGANAGFESAMQHASPLLESQSLASMTSGLSPILGSPRLFISPPASSQPSRDPSPVPPHSRAPDRLAPPDASFHRPDYHEHHDDIEPTPDASPRMSLKPEVPRIAIPNPPTPRSPPSSAFPVYTDTPTHLAPATSRPPSIRLPPPPTLSPVASPHLAFATQEYDEDAIERRTFKWWPYRYLPPPLAIIRALFPTIYPWTGKSISDKLLGIVTVPSVFLLTITLPIVESEGKTEPMEALSGLLTPKDGPRSRVDSLIQLPLDSPEVIGLHHSANGAHEPHKQSSVQVYAQNSNDDPDEERKDWNRWLVCVQLFTAPLFTVMILWANLDHEHDVKSLLWFILCSLLFSLICLYILLATTMPDRPPKHRSLLCFLGFAVAVAWISTIANEVVGVLKALGVILGISDAILGLTIFAVGNSLGDLVADITIANLGQPVMALSACFGGPMLNILLGIGVSGLYITIRHGAKAHDKHPDRPIKYKPYEIEVSTTLLISAITLLVTLVGLLIVVPLNGWKMDRKVGVGLICLWSLSTLGNVIVEVLGWGRDLAVF